MSCLHCRAIHLYVKLLYAVDQFLPAEKLFPAVGSTSMGYGKIMGSNGFQTPLLYLLRIYQNNIHFCSQRLNFIDWRLELHPTIGFLSPADHRLGL